MHKDFGKHSTQVRTKADCTNNAKTEVYPVNFGIVDYVMIHPALPRSHKLNIGWMGPMRVTDTLSV